MTLTFPLFTCWGHLPCFSPVLTNRPGSKVLLVPVVVTDLAHAPGLVFPVGVLAVGDHGSTARPSSPTPSVSIQENVRVVLYETLSTFRSATPRSFFLTPTVALGIHCTSRNTTAFSRMRVWPVHFSWPPLDESRSQKKPVVHGEDARDSTQDSEAQYSYVMLPCLRDTDSSGGATTSAPLGHRCMVVVQFLEPSLELPLLLLRELAVNRTLGVVPVPPDAVVVVRHLVASELHQEPHQLHRKGVPDSCTVHRNRNSANRSNLCQSLWFRGYTCEYKSRSRNPSYPGMQVVRCRCTSPATRSSGRSWCVCLAE